MGRGAPSFAKPFVFGTHWMKSQMLMMSAGLLLIATALHDGCKVGTSPGERAEYTQLQESDPGVGVVRASG